MFKVIEEKIAVPLIIILTLFVLGGIYYSVNLADKEFEEATEYTPIKSKKKDSTENWQTYRNEEFGFEFKYPGEYGEVSIEQSFGTEITAEDPIYFLRFENMCEIVACEEGYWAEGYIQISASNPRFAGFGTDRPYPNIAGYSIDDNGVVELINENNTGFEKASERPRFIFEDVSFDTKGAIGILLTRSFEEIFVERTSVVFNLSDSAPATGIEFMTHDKLGQAKNKENLIKIARTFKIIEPIDTSNWQTYRNEEFGFEFKYPEKIEVALYESGGNNFECFAEKTGIPSIEGLPACIFELNTYSAQYDNLEDEGIFKLSDIREIIEESGTIRHEVIVGQEWVYVENLEGPGGSAGFYTYTPDEDSVIELRFVDLPSNTQLESTNQILSTFKFIE